MTIEYIPNQKIPESFSGSNSEDGAFWKTKANSKVLVSRIEIPHSRMMDKQIDE